jgi:pimeloyl-ACP methyl ester carboxylesterase
MPSTRTRPVLSRLRVPSRHVRVHAHVLDRGRGHVDVHAARWDAAPGAPADAPVHVCVHGLGGSCVNWALLGPRLAAHGPVWAPDLAGFGLTLPTHRSASVEDNLDLLAGFVEMVAGGRPVVLLGNSMGGHLAFSLAAARPERVAGLVLVGPAVPVVVRRPDPRVAARFALFATPVAGRMWLEQLTTRLTPAEQVRATMELCTADPDALAPEIFEAHVELNAARRLMPHTHLSYLEAARSLLRRLGHGRKQVWADIDAVTAPTLVLQGALDRLVTLESVERVLERRPDWAARVYPDLGHIVMLEDPDRVAGDIAAWRATGGA